MNILKTKILGTSLLLSLLAAANAGTVTVTVRDDGASNIGAPGTFYWALTNCSPGDTIAFNIAGAGPHFLVEPPNGFPLIYQKHGITIDGYTQPGAVANSNPITSSNNAQIKIVIDGRNTHARSLDYFHYDGTLSTSDPAIDNTALLSDANPTTGGEEAALLAIYRSTNVTIKGLAFLADDVAVGAGSGLSSLVFGIGIIHDYGLDTTVHDALEYPLGDSRNAHIAGCWFGLNPTNAVKSAVNKCAYWINFPRHKGDDGSQPAGSGTKRPSLPNVGLTIGVAPGAANPRSEFNVFVGGIYAFAGEPMRLRISGNFVSVMPDGVTPYDFPIDCNDAFLNAVWSGYVACMTEFGRYGEDYLSSATQAQPIVIGTDGDGTNDADEGNLWGPSGSMLGKASISSHRPAIIHWYRSANNTFLIAGNTWGAGIDGRRWTNSAFFISGLYLNDEFDGKSKLIIGPDFATNRRAATIAAQANHFYNNWPIQAFGNPPGTDNGIVPFIEYENPKATSGAAPSTNAWISLRGNVMVGNGIGPVNYADSFGDLLVGLTNFFATYADTSASVLPTLDTNSVFPQLMGTFAPGNALFTNVIIDLYELDQEGWTNGKAFALTELIDSNTGKTNGFPQGKKYLGSFPVANTGTFNITLPPQIDLGSGQITITANYSQDLPGTPLARTATSDFSLPITIPARPVISVTRSGNNLDISWNPDNGLFTVQTNSSVNSGTWGNFTSGNVAPSVSVPIGQGPLFIRLKQ